MKRENQSTYRRSLWMSLISSSILLLAACGTSANSPIAPVATTGVTATSLPPTAAPSLPSASPTQPAVQSTPVPIELVATPTVATVALSPIDCAVNRQLTPAQTEGPYYTPNSPERTSLIEPGMGGTKLVVSGYVLTPECKPVAGAWLDFWQADDQGVYDNAGYRLRGHLFTDESGRYTLETIVPGEYPGRPPHIHVKVQAPNGPILTAQIYFPDEPSNTTDSIFDPALLADVQDTAEGKVATFNFVVNP